MEKVRRDQMEERQKCNLVIVGQDVDPISKRQMLCLRFVPEEQDLDVLFKDLLRFNLLGITLFDVEGSLALAGEHLYETLEIISVFGEIRIEISIETLGAFQSAWLKVQGFKFVVTEPLVVGEDSVYRGFVEGYLEKVIKKPFTYFEVAFDEDEPLRKTLEFLKKYERLVMVKE